MKKILLLVIIGFGVVTAVTYINKEPIINKESNNASDYVVAPRALEKTNGHTPYLSEELDTLIDRKDAGNEVESQSDEHHVNDTLIAKNEVFNTKRFNALLFSDSFTTETYNYITDNKTNESVENQLYLHQTFNESIRYTPQFSNLSLELAECDADLCVLSLSGLERLSKDDITQLEDELLFNKQGMSKIAAKGVGGTYGIVEKDGYSYFRIVYVTNSRFTGVN